MIRGNWFNATYIYKSVCSKCHKERRRGVEPPSPIPIEWCECPEEETVEIEETTCEESSLSSRMGGFKGRVKGVAFTSFFDHERRIIYLDRVDKTLMSDDIKVELTASLKDVEQFDDYEVIYDSLSQPDDGRTIKFIKKKPATVSIPVVHIFFRSEDGRRFHVIDDTFRPFFFVEDGTQIPQEVADRLTSIDPMEDGFKGYTAPEFRDRYTRVWSKEGVDGKTVRALSFVKPGDTYDLREPFQKTYNAKVEFAYNYLVCKEIIYGVTYDESTRNLTSGELCKIGPRKLHIDIEVDQEKQVYPMSDDAKFAIVSAVLYDSYTREYYAFVWHPSFEVNYVKGKSNDGKTVHIHMYGDEREMLRDLLGTIKELDPDYIMGWNVEQFDLSYLINRCRGDKEGHWQGLGISREIDALSPLSGFDYRTVYIQDFDEIEKRHGGKLSIAKRKRMEFYSKWQVRIKGRIVLDLIKAYKVLYQGVQRDSYRLEDIAQTELKVGKVQHEETIHDLWMNHPSDLMNYNLRDVELTVRLDEELGIVEHFEAMRRLAGVQVDDILSKITLCKYILLRASPKPLTTERIRESTEEWHGGRLIIPRAVEVNVLNLDLTQLYPNIMVICNISPDTVVGVFDTADEYEAKKEELEKYKPVIVAGTSGKIYVFRTDRIGLIPSQLGMFINLRKQTKAEMKACTFGTPEYEGLNTRQVSYKHTTAAFYGISSLLFEFNLGDPITGVGRDVNRWTEEKCKENGYDVVYLDTDSTFPKAHTNTLDDMIAEGKELEKTLNASYPEFLERYGNVQHPERMGIEFKEIHRKIFFKGRRRYASCLWWNEGQIIDPPDLFKVGMESKRSDTSRFARELLDGVLRAWLVDGASIQTLAKTVRLAKEQMSNGTHRLEDIAFPSGLERQLEDYKGNNPRVRSRQFSNKYFGTRYYRGSHVKILYVKAKSSGGELDMFGNPKYSDHQKSTNCIAFEVDEDIPSDFWAYYAIDYDRMLKRNITNRLEAIFEAEGTTMDDALIGMKQATLF